MSEVGVKYQGDATDPVQATEQLMAVLLRLDETLQKVQKGTEETGEESEETGKKLTRMERAVKSANARLEATARVSNTARTSLGLVAKGSGLVAASYVAAGAAIARVSAQGTEQTRVNDVLSASLKGLTDDADEQRAMWAALQDQITQASQVDTDFGDEEISNTLANLIRLTGDYEASRASLNTVLGISVATGKSTVEASNQVGKALKGNIEALQELTSLNKTQLADLQKITDDQERGARAAEILAAQYGELAITTGTAGGTLKDMSDVGGDVVQVLGQIVNASGAVQAMGTPFIAMLREQEGSLKDNSVEAQQLALTVADYLVASFDALIALMGTGARVIYGTSAALKVGANSAEIFARSTAMGAETVLYFTSEVLGFAVARLEDYLGTMANVAEVAGADGIAGQLRTAEESARGFREEVDSFSADRLEGIKAQFAGMNEATEDSADAMVQLGKDLDAVNEGVEKATGLTDKMRTALYEARQNVEPLGDGFNDTAKSSGQVADNVERIKTAMQGMSMEEANLRAIVLGIEEDILKAQQSGDRTEEIRLERTRAQMQSELDLLGAANEDLGMREQRNALLEAQLTYERDLAEIQQSADEKLATRQIYIARMAALQEEDELTRGLLEIDADRLALQYETLSAEERAYEQARLLREESELRAKFAEEEAQAAQAVADARAQEIQAAARLASQGTQQGFERGIDTGVEIRKAALQEQIIALKEIEGEQSEREIERLERLIALEEQRAAALSQTSAGVANLGAHLGVLSTQNWDLVEGQDAYIGALNAAGQIGAGISSLLVKDRAKLAAIEAIIQAGLGTAATAMFVKSGGLAVNFGAAAASHFSAAASMGIAAARGGESAPTGAGSAGLSGGGGGGSGSSAGLTREREPDRRSLTRDLADAVRDGLNGDGGPQTVNYVDMKGALVMSSSPQGRQQVTDYVMPELQKRGVISRVSSLDRL